MVFTEHPESDTLAVMHFDLGAWDNGRGDGVLIGREDGELARAALEAAIRAHVSASEPVGIDAHRVRAMSVPFADGFFVPLLGGWLAGYYEEHPILVLGANNDVSETIAAVLRLRNLAVLSVGDGAADLLGGEPSLKEAIRVAAELRSFSASELAGALHITPQAANNRLKALVRMGALARAPVLRAAGGREFEYRVPNGAAHTEAGLPSPG